MMVIEKFALEMLPANTEHTFEASAPVSLYEMEEAGNPGTYKFVATIREDFIFRHVTTTGHLKLVAHKPKTFMVINTVASTVPVSNGVFCIYAEEASDLGNNTYEWAFGNGDNTPSTCGIVIPFASRLVAMGLNIEGATASSVVRFVLSGNADLEVYQIAGTGRNTSIEFETPLDIPSNSVVNFKTMSSTPASATNSGRVSAWFERI